MTRWNEARGSGPGSTVPAGWEAFGGAWSWGRLNRIGFNAFGEQHHHHRRCRHLKSCDWIPGRIPPLLRPTLRHWRPLELAMAGGNGRSGGCDTRKAFLKTMVSLSMKMAPPTNAKQLQLVFYMLDSACSHSPQLHVRESEGQGSDSRKSWNAGSGPFKEGGPKPSTGESSWNMGEATSWSISPLRRSKRTQKTKHHEADLSVSIWVGSFNSTIPLMRGSSFHPWP